MQLILIITAFATFTSAVDVRGYLENNCEGEHWVCANITSGTCCNFPSKIRSMFWDLPANAGGIGYNGPNCTEAAYSPVSSAENLNFCWNYGVTPSPVISGKWVAGSFTRRMARGESQMEARDNCIPASVFIFTHDGTTTVLNVPEGSVGQVVDLAAKDDYEELKKLGKGWMSVSNDLGPGIPPT